MSERARRKRLPKLPPCQTVGELLEALARLPAELQIETLGEPGVRLVTAYGVLGIESL